MRQKNLLARRESSVAVEFQTLESRRLLAAVTVNGSSSGDEIRVYVASNTIIVDVNGFPSSYPDVIYDGIVVNALGGADSIVVDSNADNPVTINGGSGADSISVGKTDNSLAGIESPVSVGSSGGADQLFIHNGADPFDNTFNITSSGVARDGSPPILAGDSGLVVVYGGGGVDTFDVTSTGTSNRYELLGADGDDIYNVRDTNGASVVVDGQGGFDLLNVNSNLGQSAAVRIESNQDFSRIDAAPGGTIQLVGAAGVYLNSNLSDFEGDLVLDTGFLVEHNSQIVSGQNYWRDRLINAASNTSPQVRSDVATASLLNDTVGYGYKGSGVALSEIGGFPLVSGDLVLRYALRGDADLDRIVRFDDLLIVAKNYAMTTMAWTRGDFDLNGTTDFTDLLAIAQNYGVSYATSAPRGVAARKADRDALLA